MDRIKAMAIGFLFINAVVSFIVATEGYPWFYHFQYIWNWINAHLEVTLIGTLIFGTAFYWWWRFEQGEV